MHNRLSDADLVATLRALESAPSFEAACAALGLKASQMRQRAREAKQRGLTANSLIRDETDLLKARVSAAEAAQAAAEADRLDAVAIRERIYHIAGTPPAPPAWLDKPSGKNSSGVPVTIWSDWHLGEVVDPNEVGGVNAFNSAIARDRVTRLVDATCDLALHHMTSPRYPGIVVMLGGDMVTGEIHEELRETNDGYLNQTLLEAQDLLAAALERMIAKFGKVFVPCVVGNHGRMTLKPRAKGRVYTNFEWNLYCQLARYFRNEKRIHFHIPNETDAFFTVVGHRFMLTHGDTLGVKGGDGIIGVLGPITRGATKVGRSEAQIGRDFDTLVMGHWHTYIPHNEAVPVIVNGTLKGYDEYARLFLRARYARPSQALFFVHPKHGITASWPVYLEPRVTARDTAEWVTVLK